MISHCYIPLTLEQSELAHVLAALMGPDTVVDTELRLAFRSVKQVLQVRGRIVLLEPRAFFLAAETKLNAIPVGPNNAYNFDPLQEMYQNLHPSIQRGLMANNLIPPDMPPNETAAATKSCMRTYANVVQTYYTNVTTTTDIGGQASTSTIQANMGFPTCLVSVARVLDGTQADQGRSNCATFETMFPDADPNEGLGQDPSPPPAFVATVGAANPASWALSAAPLSSTVGAASSLANPTLLAQAFTGSPLQGHENFNLQQDAVAIATDAYGPTFGFDDLYAGAAFALVSVAEKCIGDATGNAAPSTPRLCWGCNGDHQWRDCNRRNDPACIANFRRAVADFRSRTPPRYRSSSGGYTGGNEQWSYARTAAQRVHEENSKRTGDNWQTMGYPSKEVADLIVGISNPSMVEK